MGGRRRRGVRTKPNNIHNAIRKATLLLTVKSNTEKKNLHVWNIKISG